MSWYYAKNGQRNGPVTEAEIGDLIASGVIQADDLLWTEEFGDVWKPAREVPAFTFPKPSAQPPPPPSASVGPSAGARQRSAPAMAADAHFVSATHNRDLMAAARAALRGHWGVAVGVTLIMFAIDVAINVLAQIPFVGIAASVGGLLIAGALRLGVAIFILSLARSGMGTIEQAFSGFQRFGVAFLALLLVSIFTFLWTLLLIIPGIIAALRYSQTWFILADNPQMSALDAIRRSKLMMHGNKWKYFCLQFRFLGWALLCILTLGIGFIWLAPYIVMTNAKFYEDLKTVA